MANMSILVFLSSIIAGVAAQFVPAPSDLTQTKGFLDMPVRYKQVADGICQLHETGFAGTTLSFVDYVQDFPYFRDTVLPILASRGIR